MIKAFILFKAVLTANVIIFFFLIDDLCLDYIGLHFFMSVCSNMLQDQFHRHLLLEAERRQLRPIIENKSRIVLVHTTSGYKYGCYLLCFWC